MAKKKQKQQLEKEYPTQEEFDKILTRCIKCYRCRDVCPICNCKVCSLEKQQLQQGDEEKPDPLLMHGIRLSHMAFSCINCGQCEDVCPMDIPLAKMYQKVQLRYRQETGYVAGCSDDKAPMFSGIKEDIAD